MSHSECACLTVSVRVLQGALCFRKRVTNHRALLRKMTFDHKASSDSECACRTGWRSATCTHSTWRSDRGCLMFIGHFLQKSPVISDSFAENVLPLKTSDGSSPPCSCIICECVSVKHTTTYLSANLFAQKKKASATHTDISVFYICLQTDTSLKDTKTYLCVKHTKTYLFANLHTHTFADPPDPINHVYSLPGKYMSQKYFTYPSVQIFTILFREFMLKNPTKI